MAVGQMNEMLRCLRGTALARLGAEVSDGQLLERYLQRQDGAALSALVRRHGPMVWGVCLRVLRNPHDAEDAFQATFLVLLRKAATLASRELVGHWLYGVAYQTARKARSLALRRGQRERQMAELPDPCAPDAATSDSTHHVDLELHRLPTKYRAPLVLCDLEGLTRKEAARQLGCPEGTVAGRLARARQLLARRLSRHGVASIGLLATAGAVPSGLVAATLRSAQLMATGSTALLPLPLKTLVQGVLHAMFLSKLQMVGTTLLLLALAVGLVGYGSAVAAVGDPVDPVSRTDEEAAPKVSPPLMGALNGFGGFETKEPTIQELKERVAAANRRVQESQDDKSLRTASDALALAVRDLQVGLNRTAQGQADVKVIPLKHTAATEVERVLRELFNKRPVQINSLARTNAIVLQGTPAELENLAAVIKLLDDQAEKHAERTKK